MRPTLKQFQYLIAIADTGKFKDAALKMNVSQPSLSTQLADMETELEAQLVERGRHGAVLTPIGETVVQQARHILQSAENLKNSTRHGSGELVGRIRLGVTPSVGPYLLPHVTGRLHSLFPNLRLSVQEHRTSDLDVHLRSGKVDTVISTAEDHPETRSMILCREDLWICVPPDSPLADSPGPVELKQLSGLPLLSIGYGHHLNKAIHDLALASGAYVSSEYEGTSLDAIRQMAAMGAGVAVLPSLYALLEASRDKDLVVRRINNKKAHRDISLIWRDTSPLQQDFRKLGEIIHQIATDLLAENTK